MISLLGSYATQAIKLNKPFKTPRREPTQFEVQQKHTAMHASYCVQQDYMLPILEIPK